MKNVKIIGLIVIILLQTIKLDSQSSTLSHIGAGPADYLGWQNNAIPLWFQTSGFNRLIIDNGNQTQTGGRIAIGNNLPNNFAPQSRVHIHQTGGGGLNNTFIRFTTNVTNNTASDGFAIGNSTQGFTGNNA